LRRLAGQGPANRRPTGGPARLVLDYPAAAPHRRPRETSLSAARRAHRPARRAQRARRERGIVVARLGRWAAAGAATAAARPGGRLYAVVRVVQTHGSRRIFSRRRAGIPEPEIRDR